MPMNRRATAAETATSNDDREKAVAWVNVSLINSKGKKLQFPVGIPLMGSSDDPLIQLLLNQAHHGQTFEGELRISFVGESKSPSNIEL